MSLLLQSLKFAKGIDPIANAFAGTVRSDVYSMSEHGRVLFVVYAGVGATGTSTITVNACDNTTPSTRAAIAFWSRDILTGDTDSAITRRAAAGYIPAAGSSKIILIEADASDLAASGYEFVELTAVESVASAVLGGVMAILGGAPGRYTEDVNATVIV